MKRQQSDRPSSTKDRRQGSGSSRSSQSRRDRRDSREGHPKSSRHQSRGESLSSKIAPTPTRSRQAVFASDDEENGANEVHLYGKVTTVDPTGTKPPPGTPPNHRASTRGRGIGQPDTDETTAQSLSTQLPPTNGGRCDNQARSTDSSRPHKEPGGKWPKTQQDTIGSPVP